MLNDRNPIELEEEIATLEETFKKREFFYLKANLISFGFMVAGLITATAMYNYIHTMLPGCPPCNC